MSRFFRFTCGLCISLVYMVLALFWASSAMAQSESSVVQTANIGTNQVTMVINTGVTEDSYFTLLSGSAPSCGSATNVVNGQDSTGNLVIHGSLVLTAGVTGQYTIRNLAQGSTYTLCTTLDGTSAPESTQFTTLTPTTSALAWVNLGGAISVNYGSLSSLAIAPDGTPYLAYTDNNNSNAVSVMKFASGSWTQIGAVMSSGAMPSGVPVSLVFSPSGTLYLAYQNGDDGSPITVMELVGGSWIQVGSTVNYGTSVSLVFSPAGTPYLAYTDQNNGATVMELVNGSWTQVGSAIASGASPSLAFSPSGTPYLTYVDGNNNNAVAVTQLVNGNWTQISPELASSSDYSSLVFSPNGTPYLAYSYGVNNNTVAVFELVGGAWTQVGSAVASGSTPSLAVSPAGTPYLAYADANHSNAITVTELVNGSWTTLGSAMASGAYPSLAFSPAGTLYLASGGSSENITFTGYQSEPALTTGGASAIAPSTATLSGTINPNGLAVTTYFKYGISVNGPFITVPANTAAGINTLGTNTGAMNVSANLSGLIPGTVYSYYLIAIDSNNIIYSGKLQSFTTAQLNPEVTTWPTATTIVAGQPLLVSSLQGGVASVPGSFSWTNPLALASAGLEAYSVTFTPSNSAQDSSITQPVSLTANPAAAGASPGSLFFSNVAASQLTLTLASPTAGMASFTMFAGNGESCGSAAQTLLGEDSSGTAVIHGSLMLSAGVAQQYTISNLAQSTTYTVCYSTDGNTVHTASATTHAMTNYSGNAAWSNTPEFMNPSAENINSNLTFAPDGTPYIAITSYSYTLNVMKLVGGQWISLSPIGVSMPAMGGDGGINAIHVALAFAPNGTLYLAYPTGSSGAYNLNVAEYNGSSWIPLGTVATLSEASLSGQQVSLAFTPDGTPYIGYSGINGSSVAVEKYSGGAWVPIAVPNVNDSFLGLAIAPNGLLYLTSQSASLTNIHVDQYNGSGWNQVGYPVSGQANSGIAIAPDGTLYLSTYSNLFSYQGGLWNPVAQYPVHYYGALSSFTIAPNDSPYAVLEGNQVLVPNQGLWNAFTPSVNSELLFMISFAPDGTLYGVTAGEFVDVGNPVYAVERFAPPAVATTEMATNITMTAATLNATVNTNGANSSLYFEYGTTTSYGSIANAALSASNSTATAQLSALAPNTTYHFRIDVASGGTVINGADQTFTTLTTITPSLTLTVPSAGLVYGQPATISILASSAATGGTPLAGMLYARLNQGANTSVPVSSSGQATLPVSNALAAGSNSLVVTFTPTDTVDYTSTTQTILLNVAKANSATTLTASTSSVAANQSLNLTATVSDASTGSTGTPTGVVTLMNGSTQVGSATLSGGTATFTVPASDLTPGQSYSFTANYAGDANFNASASSSSGTNIVVAPTDIQLSPAGSTGTMSQIVHPGGTATYGFNISPGVASAYPGTVAFTASGLPTGATATFSPATLPANAGSKTVTLKIQLPIAITTAKKSNPFEKGEPILFGSLLLPLLGLRRARKSWMRRGLVILLLLVGSLAGVTSLTGCGLANSAATTGGNSQGDGSGSVLPLSYTITVTATSGGATQSIPVILMVN